MIAPSKSLLRSPVVSTIGFVEVDVVVMAPDTFAFVSVAVELEPVEAFVIVPVVVPP